jgi:glycine cleavage system H lipoate-binding protein
VNQRELSISYPQLAQQVADVYDEAKKLGVVEGAERLALVSRYFKKLSIEEAYSTLDPEGFRQEIVEAQESRYHLGFWRVLRNCFSLAPLIATWLALYFATTKYQGDLTNPKYKNVDQYQSFLRLWQDGFHGSTAYTFSTAAMIDVVLLLMYAGIIIFVSILEKRAYSHTNSLAQELNSVSEELIDVIAQVGPSASTIDMGIDKIVQTIERVADAGTDKLLQAVKSVSDADVEKIVQAIKQVLDEALMSSDQVAQKAQEFIRVSNEKIDDVFNTKIKVMLDQFHDDLGTMNTDFKRLGIDLRKLSSDVFSYDKQLVNLTDASTKLATHAGDLTSSTQAYVSVGQEIRDQINALNATQHQVAANISSTQQDVARQIGVAAGHMNSVAQETALVAQELGQISKQDIDVMSKKVLAAANSVADAADTLTVVKGSLSQTNQQLQGSVLQVNQDVQQSLSRFQSQLDATSEELKQTAQVLAKVTANMSNLQFKASKSSPQRSFVKRIFGRP